MQSAVAGSLAAVLAAGVLSAWYRVWYVTGTSELAIYRGKVLVSWGHSNTAVQLGGPGLHARSVGSPGVAWWFGDAPIGYSKIDLPLWLPAAALGATCLWMRLVRQPPEGVCPVCGYALEGLIAGANCPECGGPLRRGPSSQTP